MGTPKTDFFVAVMNQRVWQPTKKKLKISAKGGATNYGAFYPTLGTGLKLLMFFTSTKSTCGGGGGDNDLV